MKKINLIFAVIFLSAHSGFTQKEVSVLINSKAVGENLLTGEPVQGIEYTFPERIEKFQIDTVNGHLLVQLRALKNEKWLANRGDVIQYDIKNQKVLWFKKTTYQVESIEQFGGITLQASGAKSFCLDNLTGQKLWEVKNTMIFADPEYNIGIGYKFLPGKGNTNILEGIDLSTGKYLWHTEINRDYGWNTISYLDDSTLLIGAAGLHSLNLFDGRGWDYHTVTGKKDYTSAALGTGLGIAAGILTGTYAVSTGHDLIRDLVSNVIVDSMNIYFASKENVVKLNSEGEIQWENNLPTDLTSKSRIFIYGNNLVMVNRGFAYKNNRQHDFGTPFIASFDVTTGEKKYLIPVTNEKKESINGVYQKDDDLLLVFADNICKYSINKGQLLNKQLFNVKEFGKLNYFLGDNFFVQKDSIFVSLSKFDSTKIYLYTESGKLLVLNYDLKTEAEIDAAEIYINYLNKGNKKFIARGGNQTYVINPEGKKVAELSTSSNSTFLNGKLYDVQKSSFLEINLKNIIDSNN